MKLLVSFSDLGWENPVVFATTESIFVVLLKNGKLGFFIFVQEMLTFFQFLFWSVSSQIGY